MKTCEVAWQAEEILPLRVFWGEEHNTFDDYPAPKPPCRDDEWASVETYWAGRNHARRQSARIAA